MPCPPTVGWTSTASGITLPFLSARTTVAPSAAKRSEIALPMPDAPPVTIAILSSVACLTPQCRVVDDIDPLIHQLAPSHDK